MTFIHTDVRAIRPEIICDPREPDAVATGSSKKRPDQTAGNIITDRPVMSHRGVFRVPLVEMYFGKGELSGEHKVGLCRKVTDLVVQEVKVPQHLTRVILHELPGENWMIDRLTVPELLAKLKTQKALNRHIVAGGPGTLHDASCAPPGVFTLQS